MKKKPSSQILTAVAKETNVRSKPDDKLRQISDTGPKICGTYSKKAPAAILELAYLLRSLWTLYKRTKAWLSEGKFLLAFSQGFKKMRQILTNDKSPKRHLGGPNPDTLWTPPAALA